MLVSRFAYILVMVIAALCAISLTGCSALANQNNKHDCELDAMLIFDASGSMAGTDWSGQVPRILHVRNALRRVLPEITTLRRIGLMTYGPGPYNRCENIVLQLKPDTYSPSQIMTRIDALLPAGRTPLSAAVRQAAEELRYREKPSTIVLLTDGEETCGGKPCEVAKFLEAKGVDVTVHVISYMWRATATGRGLLQSRCLASVTGGLQMTVETEDELVAAFRRTLGCPLLTRWNFRNRNTHTAASMTTHKPEHERQTAHKSALIQR